MNSYQGFLEGFLHSVWEGLRLLIHIALVDPRGGSSSGILLLCWLKFMYMKLCMIFSNMTIHDELWDYEFIYEVGCLILYLDFDGVMGYYYFHYTSIAWVVYMLGWYMLC